MSEDITTWIFLIVIKTYSSYRSISLLHTNYLQPEHNLCVYLILYHTLHIIFPTLTIVTKQYLQEPFSVAYVNCLVLNLYALPANKHKKKKKICNYFRCYLHAKIYDLVMLRQVLWCHRWCREALSGIKMTRYKNLNIMFSI